MRSIRTFLRLPIVAVMGLALLATACGNDTAESPGAVETTDETPAQEATAEDTEGAVAEGEEDLQVARELAAEFSDPQAALDAGYMAVEACVSNPEGEGAMGYHYPNPDLIDDTINADEPEVLVYAPTGEDGELTLGAVEYFKPDADQDLSTDDDRPTMFGQEFDGPMEGHEEGQPIHYDLHVWTGVENPAGTFAPFNPDVSCPDAATDEG